MCYRPLHIIIKPRNFNPAGGQLFTSNVSCCQCVACQLVKKSEWQFRIFYEIDDTLKNGGFVLSQAFTYDNDHVPYLSSFVPLNDPSEDIMCFDRSHIIKFLKRVRRRLERMGFIVNNNLRYFISSEYGSDPTKTRRPHYHGTFYSRVVRSDGTLLDWITLSSVLEDCWPYGRSDGFKTISKDPNFSLDPLLYFLDPFKPHVLLPADSCSYFKFNKIADYVSKYVIKDILYSDTIKNRCGKYLDSLYLCDRQSYNELYRKLKANVKEFHLQSLGFGANLFAYNNINDIIASGTIRKPSADPNKGLFEYIPIPLYFARKLFMTLRKREDNSLYWVYTSQGKEFFRLRYKRKISTLINKFSSMLADDLSLSQEVSFLLGSRSLDDFVKYLVIYKGRSKPLMMDDFPSVDFMLDSMCSVYDDISQTYNINFKDGHFYTSDNVPEYDLIYKKLNYENSCFSQLDAPFEHFDDVFVLFSSKLHLINIQKEIDAIVKIEFPNIFKNNYK